MTTIFLTPDEIAALTGKVRSQAQQIVLRTMGVQFMVRPDGKIIVSRSHVEKQLDGEVAVVTVKDAEPNWGALNNG